MKGYIEKMKQKISIIILIILIIVFFSVIILKITFGKKTDKQDDKIENSVVESVLSPDMVPEDAIINKQPSVVEEREFDGLLISNFQLSQSDVAIELFANVTNKREEDISTTIAKKIIFLDNDNNQIGAITMHIAPMKRQETVMIYSQLVYDVISDDETEFIKFDITKVVNYQIEEYTNS